MSDVSWFVRHLGGIAKLITKQERLNTMFLNSLVNIMKQFISQLLIDLPILTV